MRLLATDLEAVADNVLWRMRIVGRQYTSELFFQLLRKRTHVTHASKTAHYKVVQTSGQKNNSIHVILVKSFQDACRQIFNDHEFQKKNYYYVNAVYCVVLRAYGFGQLQLVIRLDQSAALQPIRFTSLPYS